MTPETKMTVKKILGVLGLLVWAVVMVYMLAPQLMGTAFREFVVYFMASLGIAFLIVVSIKGIAENGSRERH